MPFPFLRVVVEKIVKSLHDMKPLVRKRQERRTGRKDIVFSVLVVKTRTEICVFSSSFLFSRKKCQESKNVRDLQRTKSDTERVKVKKILPGYNDDSATYRGKEKRQMKWSLSSPFLHLIVMKRKF